MVEPLRACIAISNNSGEGIYECWRGEAYLIDSNDAGDGYEMSFDRLIFVSFIYVVFCVVLISILVRCCRSQTFRLLSG